MEKLAAGWFLQIGVSLKKALATKKLNADDIHDIRVAARKIKTLAQDFKDIYPNKCWRVSNTAAHVLQKLSTQRDNQLFVQFIRQVAKVNNAAFDKRIIAELSEKSCFPKKLRTKFFRRLQQCQRVLQKTVVNNSSGSYFEKHREKLEQLIEKYLGDYDDNRLHEIRIAAKKLRYNLECFGAKDQEWLKKAISIQEAAGEFHDLMIFENKLTAVNLEEEFRLLVRQAIANQKKCVRESILEVLKK
ncbi:MAG: CHAD domain-containing protein [Negativicutes bacterium]|jgi:CHAD domain-containing protein